jgi:hypothetical protein
MRQAKQAPFYATATIAPTGSQFRSYCSRIRSQISGNRAGFGIICRELRDFNRQSDTIWLLPQIARCGRFAPVFSFPQLRSRMTPSEQ